MASLTSTQKAMRQNYSLVKIIVLNKDTFALTFCFRQLLFIGRVVKRAAKVKHKELLTAKVAKHLCAKNGTSTKDVPQKMTFIVEEFNIIP